MRSGHSESWIVMCKLATSTIKVKAGEEKAFTAVQPSDFPFTFMCLLQPHIHRKRRLHARLMHMRRKEKTPSGQVALLAYDRYLK